MSNYDVNVNFKVDSSGLNQAHQEVDKVSHSIKNAAKEATPMGNQIKGALGGAVTAASGLSASFAGVAGAASAAIAPVTALSVAAGPLTLVAAALAAIGVAAVGTFAAVSSRLGTINDLNDAMENLGGRTEGLAELFSVFELSGVSTEKAAASLQKFQNNIAKTVESGDDVAAALGRAGVDMRKLSELAKTDVAGAYKMVLFSLEGVADKNDLALIKQKLLGKSMAETAQIAKNAAEYEEKLAFNRSIGLVTTKEQVALAGELDSAWDELKAAGKGLANQLVDMFGPTVVTMVKGLANGVVVVAQSMQSLNKWVKNTFGSFDTLLRKFSPIYALAVKLFNLTGRLAKQNAANYIGKGEDDYKPEPEPVENETDKQREAAAKKAEAAAKAAESARAKAAAEAKRHLEAYNNMLERSIELQRTINDDSVTEGFATIIQTGPNSGLIDQFNAAAATAKQVGLIVDGWNVSLDGTSIELQTRIGPEMEKIAAAAGKTTEELKRQGDAAVAAAESRARANREDAATLEVYKERSALETQTLADAQVMQAILSGRIQTEDQLTRYLADQAFHAMIIRKEAEGASAAEIERLKTAREQAEVQGKATDDAISKMSEAEAFYKKVSEGFVNTFVDGLAKGQIAWKEWLMQLAADLLKSQLLKMLKDLGQNASGGGQTGGWMGVISAIAGMFGGGQANGGAWNNGVQMFAKGGVVNGATAFGMAGGKWGVMGEAGPEAIMPLTRGPNGKLGVAAHGGGGTQVINLGNTTINVQSTSDSARDDRETAKAIDRMLTDKMNRFLAEQRRSGNSLNPNYGFRY